MCRTLYPVLTGHSARSRTIAAKVISVLPGTQNWGRLTGPPLPPQVCVRPCLLHVQRYLRMHVWWLDGKG
jgi:hypothetical protein